MFINYVKPEDKSRNWCFVAYPESLPITWFDNLQNSIVPGVVSPLHSSEEEENEEKPHYHVMLSFSSPASAKKVLAIIYSCEIEKGLAGYRDKEPNYSMIQPVGNFSSMVRYFCHLDQPDKEKLKWEDMRSFNGLDIDCVLSPTFSQELDYCNEIIDYCEAAEIYYFYDLINYARENMFDTWFVFLKNNSYFIKEYLRSKSSKREYKVKKALLSDEERAKLERSKIVKD